MKGGRQRRAEDLSIVSAVEALSNIADLEFEATARDSQLVSEMEEQSTVLRTVRWLHQKNAERMLSIIRDKMGVVLNYLKHFYKAERGRFARRESIEGIRTIMLLVDEAADNLDRYTKLFLGSRAKSVKNTKEFLSLCTFYKKKILPIATHAQVASWIGALPLQTILEKATLASGLPVDLPPMSVLGAELEGVKDDREYELLFLRQPDGSRFFSPKMLRSMKLASEVESATLRDPRMDAEVNGMAQAQSSAEIRHILGEVYPLMDAFFHMASKARDREVYLSLYKACVALMEASVQSVHQTHKEGAKATQEYFRDFVSSFNEILQLPEFQRMLAYPPRNEYSWEHSLFRLTQALSSAMIAGTPLAPDLIEGMRTLAVQALTKMADEAVLAIEKPSRRITAEGNALRHFLRTLKGSMLAKMVGQLEESGWPLFEPLLGESVPNRLFDLSWRGSLIPIVRLPSPTRQEYINKARISEAFQIAIRRYLAQKKACLIINLQERTNWRESARSFAIEQLSKGLESDERLYVLTQNRSGDFYEQTGSYADMHLSGEFKEQLLSQVIEAGSGSIWPREVDERFTNDVRALIQAIHKTIYGGRNVITRVRRIEFIELVYNMMILRAVGMLHPDVIFLSCKNGLDVTLTTMASLFCLQSALQDKQLSQEDVEWLRTILYGLPLIHRRRLLFQDRQEHLCSFVRFLEDTLSALGKAEKKELKEAIAAFLPHEIMNAVMLPATGHRSV